VPVTADPAAGTVLALAPELFGAGAGLADETIVADAAGSAAVWLLPLAAPALSALTLAALTLVAPSPPLPHPVTAPATSNATERVIGRTKLKQRDEPDELNELSELNELNIKDFPQTAPDDIIPERVDLSAAD
jgi:hypothetical protein